MIHHNANRFMHVTSMQSYCDVCIAMPWCINVSLHPQLTRGPSQPQEVGRKENANGAQTTVFLMLLPEALLSRLWLENGSIPAVSQTSSWMTVKGRFRLFPWTPPILGSCTDFRRWRLVVFSDSGIRHTSTRIRHTSARQLICVHVLYGQTVGKKTEVIDYVSYAWPRLSSCQAVYRLG